MSQAMSWDGAMPITVERLRANRKSNEVQPEIYVRLIDAIVLQFSKALQQFNPSPVKCSLVTVGNHTLPVAEQKIPSFRYSSDKGPLRAWLKVERQFELLLCELCLGGIGHPGGEYESSRPSTKLEQKLSSQVVSHLSEIIAEAINAVDEIGLALLNEPVAPTSPEKVGPEDCLKIDLLVNVFSHNAEIQLFLHRDELGMLLGVGRKLPDLNSRNALDVLSSCPFEVKVFLQSANVSLDSLLSLKVGSILALGIKPEAPIHLVCEGREVFVGQLGTSGQRNIITLSHELLAK